MAQPPKTDPFPLSPEQIQRLRPLPRHEQATLLLSARPLPGGLAGPLDSSSAFSDDVARLAYFVHLAWMHGCVRGILHGKPAYEARETLASRVRNAITRANSPAVWGIELFGRAGINGKIEALTAEDTMWWRRVSRDDDRAHWRVLRSPLGVTEVLSAAVTLSNWLAALRDPAKTAADVDATPTLQTEI